MATVRTLRETGADIVHLRPLGPHKMRDDRIMVMAADEARIVITFDLDFGKLLAALGDSTQSVILFRMRNHTPSAVTPRSVQVESWEVVLLEGALTLVEDQGLSPMAPAYSPR